MHAPDVSGLLGLQLAAGLAEQRVDEQATAHADATVDAPHRELDADALERFAPREQDRKSTRLNSSHSQISYAVFCLKKKKVQQHDALGAANPIDVDVTACWYP